MIRNGPLARRVYELPLPQGVRVSREHNSCRKLCGVLAIHSKDASGPEENAQPGNGPLARRVYELCPPQGIRVSREHNL